MFRFFKDKTKQKPEQSLHAVVDGQLVNVTKVHDEVFSARIMGDGYAIRPDESTEYCEVYAPVSGIVTTVFPTKHAVGIRVDNGLDILVHFGIDTVEMEGRPFELFVAIDDKVTPDTKLAAINLTALRQAHKITDLIVVCTSAKEVERLSIDYDQAVTAQSVVGTLVAK